MGAGDPLTHVGYLRFFEDTNVRARSVPFAAGDHVDVPGLAITVRDVTSDARPATVDVRFDVPLEDPSLRWMKVDEDGELVAMHIPKPGDAPFTLAPV